MILMRRQQMISNEYTLTLLHELEEKIKDASGPAHNLAMLAQDSKEDALMHEFFSFTYCTLLDLEIRVANIYRHFEEAADGQD